MNLTLTPAETKILRWLLETVVTDQEHFLEDDDGVSLTPRLWRGRAVTPSDAGATPASAATTAGADVRETTRAKRCAERLLTKLAQPRCRIQVVSTRDMNGDSEIHLIPVRTAVPSRKRGVW